MDARCRHARALTLTPSTGLLRRKKGRAAARTRAAMGRLHLVMAP